MPGATPSSPGTFFHGRNSYQNHSKTQNQHTHEMGEGFCKGSVRFVFLYHFAYTHGICSGNLKTNDLCFYGFLWETSPGRGGGQESSHRERLFSDRDTFF